jgi:hypothetical protein
VGGDVYPSGLISGIFLARSTHPLAPPTQPSPSLASFDMSSFAKIPSMKVTPRIQRHAPVAAGYCELALAAMLQHVDKAVIALPVRLDSYAPLPSLLLTGPSACIYSPP